MKPQRRIPTPLLIIALSWPFAVAAAVIGLWAFDLLPEDMDFSIITVWGASIPAIKSGFIERWRAWGLGPLLSNCLACLLLAQLYCVAFCVFILFGPILRSQLQTL